MSLLELRNFFESSYEADFFESTEITHSPVDFINKISSYSSNSSARARPRPIIRFKWAGFKKGGCTAPFGICFIATFSTSEDDMEEVDLIIEGDKLSIVFNEYSNSNFGLTTDGYLPLIENVAIPEEIAKDYNLTNIAIKSGIYKAII